uniref:Thioredoxin domain-containing protein n=1 Tax=Alexandrium catenella TaxID=2925 RepID=A0A7S1PT74_ALECA|mmetsp:Transcript_112196/g.298178  ORF Transcript_112196/g.298178 Transcript_112196/m.298178 type:complete len:282 (+) Transcript_112196:135-980(+)
MPSMAFSVHIFVLLLLPLAMPAVGSDDAGPLSLEQSAGQEQAAIYSRANALRLNAHTFSGNVLRKPMDEHAEHWVVSFCPNWWEPCQNLALPFDQFSVEWERRLNTRLLTKKVRFATVDCATDKVLCNQQRVEQYPTVHHYHRGKRAATWVGGRTSDVEKLAKFLTKRLSNAAADAAATALPTGGGAAAAPAAAARSLRDRLVPGDRAIDLTLIIVVLSLNTWAVFSNPRLWQLSSGASKDTSKGAAASAASAASPSAASSRSVQRFLPRDWGVPGASMEL